MGFLAGKPVIRGGRGLLGAIVAKKMYVYICVKNITCIFFWSKNFPGIMGL
jgi:hypothetical protein